MTREFVNAFAALRHRHKTLTCQLEVLGLFTTMPDWKVAMIQLAQAYMLSYFKKTKDDLSYAG